jgi:hypothetical protein
MNPNNFTKGDFVVFNTRSDRPTLAILVHDDLGNEDGVGCTDTMESGQTSRNVRQISYKRKKPGYSKQEGIFLNAVRMMDLMRICL